MMRFIIECDDPKEFAMYFKGPKLYAAVWEFGDYLRQQWKYRDCDNEAWFTAAQELSKVLIDNGIDMEEDYS
jgi:hypothetical protein